MLVMSRAASVPYGYHMVAANLERRISRRPVDARARVRTVALFAVRSALVSIVVVSIGLGLLVIEAAFGLRGEPAIAGPAAVSVLLVSVLAVG